MYLPRARHRAAPRSYALHPMTDLPYLTERHEAHRATVRDFAARWIAPIAAELDRTCRYPWENVRRMADAGFLGIPIPERWGGTGLDQLSYYVTLHELAKVDASHAVIVSAHTNLVTNALAQLGTDAQRDTFLRPLAGGRVIGAFGLTERESGSDAAGMHTTYEDAGDHYILRGEKIFISQAGVAEVVVAVARAIDDPRRTTAFILSKATSDPAACLAHGVGHLPDLPRTPGFRSTPGPEKMGWRAVDWGTLHLEEARVPKSQVLGAEGDGFRNFLKLLDGGRIGIAAISLGIAEGAYELAREWAGTRRQFGKAIGAFQGVSFALADLATEISAGRHLLYHAGWLKEQGRPYKIEAAKAKLFCSELAMRATTQAVQVFGGRGYTKEFAVERFMRDAKICEIGEGTSEVQRLIIARSILGDIANG